MGSCPSIPSLFRLFLGLFLGLLRRLPQRAVAPRGKEPATDHPSAGGTQEVVGRGGLSCLAPKGGTRGPHTQRIQRVRAEVRNRC